MNEQQNHKFRESFLLFYIFINGMSVGRSVAITRNMIDNGYDTGKMIALILWAAMVVHSGTRMYQIYRDKQNNNNQR